MFCIPQRPRGIPSTLRRPTLASILLSTTRLNLPSSSSCIFKRLFDAITNPIAADDDDDDYRQDLFSTRVEHYAEQQKPILTASWHCLEILEVHSC